MANEFKKVKENEELQEDELSFKGAEGKFNELVLPDDKNAYVMPENEVKDMIGDVGNKSVEKSAESPSRQELDEASKILDNAEIHGEQKIEVVEPPKKDDINAAEKEQLQEGSDILNSGEFV